MHRTKYISTIIALKKFYITQIYCEMYVCDTGRNGRSFNLVLLSYIQLKFLVSLYAWYDMV